MNLRISLLFSSFFIILFFYNSALANAISVHYVNLLDNLLRHNLTVHASKMSLNSLAEMKYSSRSFIFPQIRLQGDVGIKSDEINSNSDFYNIELNLEQSVLDYSSYNNYKLSKHQFNLGRLNDYDINSKLIYQMTSALLDYSFVLKIYNLRKDNLETANKMLSSTNKRFRAGELSKTDIWQIESRRYNLSASLEQAKLNLDKAINNAKMLGINDLDLSTIVPNPNIDYNVDISESVKIKTAEEKSKIAKINKQSSVAEFIPKIYIKSNYSRNEYFDSTISTEFDRSVSINITAPLFSGGRDYYSFKAKSFQYLQTISVLSDLKYRAQVELQDLIQEVKRLEVVFKNYTKAHEISLKSLNGVRNEFRRGSKSSVDLLAAQQELISATEGMANIENAFKKLKFMYLLEHGDLSISKLRRLSYE